MRVSNRAADWGLVSVRLKKNHTENCGVFLVEIFPFSVKPKGSDSFERNEIPLEKLLQLNRERLR